MDLPIFILYALAAAALMHFIRYATTAQTVLGLALKKPNIKIASRDDCPEYLKYYYELEEEKLIPLGFHYVYSLEIDNIFVRRFPSKLYFVYYNPEEKCYASLSPSDNATQAMVFQVAFETHYTNGHRLLTLNGQKHTILGKLPNTTLTDLYTDSLENQFHFHLEQRDLIADKDIKEYMEGIKSDIIVQRESDYHEVYLENLKTDGNIYPAKTDEGIFLIRTFAALRFAHQIIMGGIKETRLFNKSTTMGLRGSPEENTGCPVELEVTNYLNSVGLMNQPTRNIAGKFLFLALSIILFALAFGFILGFKLMVIILVVVLIHESGHLLAMRLVGYKNLSMLFIPLFGAVAMGSDKGLPAYKRVIAFFAGPVPGLILVFFLVAGHNPFTLTEMVSETFLNVISMLFILNYFNLLPIMPLDGGQVLNVTLFSRLDWLQLIFSGFSFIGMLGLAFLLGAPALVFISVFSLVGIKQYFDRKKILDGLESSRKENPDMGENDVLKRIFLILRKGTYRYLPFSKKVRFVQDIEHRIHTPQAPIGTIVLTVLVYLFLMAAPFVYLIGAAVYFALMT